MTGRDIDPMFMVGAVLAIMGVVQTIRGRVAVPSTIAFWYAIEAFGKSGTIR